MLASYTWEHEARFWASLPHDERLALAIDNIVEFLPSIRDEVEVGAVVSWDDPGMFTGGAVPLVQPGQLGVLFEPARRPEGRVHFAGDHTSADHGWIEGAVESGLRAAAEVAARCRDQAAAPSASPRSGVQTFWPEVGSRL